MPFLLQIFASRPFLPTRAAYHVDGHPVPASRSAPDRVRDDGRLFPHPGAAPVPPNRPYNDAVDCPIRIRRKGASVAIQSQPTISPTTTRSAPPPATRPDGAAPPSSDLRRRDFFAAVVSGLRLHLPEPLATFQDRASTGQVKIHYGNERVHYEVWVDSQRDQIEIGLHFEDGPISTAAFLAFFDAHIVEIKHDLGPQLDLERWTSSWGHLYEILPLTRLDPALADRIARRLAALIAALQPLVETAAVPAERAAHPAEERGPWRAWRRGRR